MDAAVLDNTAFYVMAFVCSLLMGLFIRALDHMFRSAHEKKKRSTVMD